MLHKEIPFLRLGLPLCIGIISGTCFHPRNNTIIILVLIITVCFAVSLFFNKRLNNYLYGLVVSLALITTGNHLYNNEKAGFSVLEPRETIFLCSLKDYPEVKENTFAITVRLLKKYSGNEGVTLKGSMLLYHSKTDTLKNILPGDNMIIRCTPVEVTNNGNPGEFDYRFYLENHGIKYYAFTNNSDILYVNAPVRRTLRQKSFIIRERIVNMFEEKGIVGEQLALVAAITLGQRSLLDPEIKLNFSKAGAMHIMAVSGLNAGILSLFIFNILFFLKGRLATLRALITIIIIWLFAFITGLSPSVERATLMFSFLQTGKLLNRQVNGLNSVLASGFIMMVFQPSVLFDTGFQLSFVAVLFIVGFYEDLHNKLVFNGKLPDLLWQALAVTLIAQAGTLALTIMSFNRFPVYFLLTNLVVVPVSSLMIILACLLLITFPIPFISDVIAQLLDITTWLTLESTRIISSLDYSTIDNIGISLIQCIFLTIFLAVILYFLLRKETFSIRVPLIFLIIFFASGSVKTVLNKSSNELIVYNRRGGVTVGIRTGNILNIYTKGNIIPPEVARHSAVSGLKIRSDSLHRTVEFLKAGSTSIIICDKITFNDSLINNADILILTGKRPSVNVTSLQSTFKPQIIVTSEADLSYSVPENPNLLNDNIFYVRKRGACIIPL